MDDRKYNTDSCEKCRADIKEYEAELNRVLPTRNEIEQALEHHKEQLKASGATIEDDVCQVLRKTLQAAEIRSKIEAKKEDLTRYQLGL